MPHDTVKETGLYGYLAVTWKMKAMKLSFKSQMKKPFLTANTGHVGLPRASTQRSAWLSRDHESLIRYRSAKTPPGDPGWGRIIEDIASTLGD